MTNKFIKRYKKKINIKNKMLSSNKEQTSIKYIESIEYEQLSLQFEGLTNTQEVLVFEEFKMPNKFIKRYKKKYK